MKNTLILLLAGFFLAACAKDGKLVVQDIPNTCGGTGYSFTWIKYGDSHLGALAFTQIGRRSEWRFRLQPDRPGGGTYSNKVVSISAKPGGSPQPWLSISGTYADDPVLVLCVPDALTVGTDIDFMIEVEDVGELDPRARVVN